MVMTSGGETTREEDVVFSEPVQKRIEVALTKLGYDISPYEVRAKAGAVLENLVWACVLIVEEEGM